jgi:pimeloyl-ACP methyl ester carboxylesterase
VTTPTQHRFTTDDGVTIAYRVWPGTVEAPPIVVHHGFTGDAERDWVDTGIVAALHESGRTVVAPDARGHGESGKPHRADAYGEARMARDLSELVDDLHVRQIDLLGFSMGAVVSVLAATTEHRIRRLVTVGVGGAVAEFGGYDRRVLPPEALATALLAEDPDTIGDPLAADFRTGLEGRDVDRVALAMQARAVHVAAIPLDRITAPTLVIAGDADPLAQRAETLAAAIPGARSLTITGDHGTCITNPAFAAAVREFFA